MELSTIWKCFRRNARGIVYFT